LKALACSATTVSSFSDPRIFPVFGSFISFLSRTSPRPSTSSLNCSAIFREYSALISFSRLATSFFSSSDMLAFRLNRWVAITIPSTPDGTSSESFFTSSPARPKIACSSFSSGVSSLRLLGTPCRPGCRRA
jgi:hypothetical protein